MRSGIRRLSPGTGAPRSRSNARDPDPRPSRPGPPFQRRGPASSLGGVDSAEHATLVIRQYPHDSHMDATVEGLEAVTVHVRDIHQARKFYGEVLGLKELQFDGTEGRAVFAIPDIRTTLRMHVYDPEEGGREPGTVSGIVFSHPDPVAACVEIARRGGTITDPPHTIRRPGFTTTLSVIADPDGNEFVLRSPPTPVQ